MSDFIDEMDKLAAALAKDANMAEKNFGDRLDAFKAMMPYYTLLSKNRGKDEPDDGLTFDNFQAAIHNAENSTGAAGTLREHTNGADKSGLPGGRKRRAAEGRGNSTDA